MLRRRGIADTNHFRTVVLAMLLNVIWLASQSLAAETLASFHAMEQLGVDWPRAMVTYRIEVPTGTVRQDDGVWNCRLVDATGEEVACQVSNVQMHDDGSLAKAWVSFFAELKADGEYRYDLQAGRPAKVGNAPKAKIDGDELKLTSDRFAVRMPAGHQEFSSPRAMRLNGSVAPGPEDVPGPVLGFGPKSSDWGGESFFIGRGDKEAPKITGYECDVTAEGPLFVEACVRYTFDNGGYYQCTVRLVQGEPLARIDEQCDLGIIRRPSWMVVFPLSGASAGPAPDVIYWSSMEGRVKGADESFEKAMERLGALPLGKERQAFGSRAVSFGEGAKSELDMVVWYPYHTAGQYVGLVSRESVEQAKTLDDVPFIGVVPMHAGNWRGMSENYNGMLVTYPDRHFALAWPLTVSPHPNDRLHTGEYDPEIPFTFIRRQWALFSGPIQYHQAMVSFRSYEGYINLDDYKDWVLDWPDTGVSYPRLLFSAEDVKRLKPHLDSHPAGEILGKLLYFTDDEKRFENLFGGLSGTGEWGSPRGHALFGLAHQKRWDVKNGCPWFMCFRQTQRASWAVEADEVLASEKLTSEQRRKLRAWIAACCYALTEPDFNPRGMMVHLGNPNMPINRFFALTFAAALIPDHPQSKEWLDVSGEYLRYKLAMNVAPNSAWSELLTYFPAAASHIIQAAAVLGQSGRMTDSLAELAVEPARFSLYLISPKDPRFDGRMVPQWGHEGADIGTHWLVAASLERQRQPELASALVWAWDQLGRPMEQHHDVGFSPRAVLHAELLENLDKDYVPQQLRSVWLPGFGVVLRSHPGRPEELMLAYRQGYMVSHCDANQGDFTLHARGVPLSTLSIHGYAIHDKNPHAILNREFGWHNRVRFGDRTNNGGWPGGGVASQVHAYSFNDSADYLRGYGDYSPQQWTRQLLLARPQKPTDEAYVVMRDSFRPLPSGKKGNEKTKPLEQTFWYLRTLGAADRVTASPTGFVYDSPLGDAALDVRFCQPSQVTIESRDSTQTGPLYNQAARNWRKAHNDPVAPGKEPNIQAEETVTVNCAGPVPAGTDIVTVLHPRAREGKPLEITSLADGVVRVVTPQSVDTVFLSAEPMQWREGDMAFTGRAGAVRVFQDEVRLIVSEAPGEVSYKGVTLQADVPTSRTVALTELKPQEIVVKTPPHTIHYSPSTDEIISSEKLAEGVTRHALRNGSLAVQIDAAEPVVYEDKFVAFRGRRGCIVLDKKADTIRLVVEDGDQASAGDVRAWNANGPYDITFYNDHIVGRSAGLGRTLYLEKPTGLDKLPMLIIDGQTYAPGSINKTLIVPLLPNEHSFEIRALEQPAIWRNWQAWSKGLPELPQVR